MGKKLDLVKKERTLLDFENMVLRKIIIIIIIQYAVCLTTGPKPLPKRFLHIVRSKASSFK
jgi:hypothetical protein